MERETERRKWSPGDGQWCAHRCSALDASPNACALCTTYETWNSHFFLLKWIEKLHAFRNDTAASVCVSLSPHTHYTTRKMHLSNQAPTQYRQDRDWDMNMNTLEPSLGLVDACVDCLTGCVHTHTHTHAVARNEKWIAVRRFDVVDESLSIRKPRWKMLRRCTPFTAICAAVFFARDS